MFRPHVYIPVPCSAFQLAGCRGLISQLFTLSIQVYEMADHAEGHAIQGCATINAFTRVLVCTAFVSALLGSIFVSPITSLCNLANSSEHQCTSTQDLSWLRISALSLPHIYFMSAGPRFLYDVIMQVLDMPMQATCFGIDRFVAE
jgi:hypothetical protein